MFNINQSKKIILIALLSMVCVDAKSQDQDPACDKAQITEQQFQDLIESVLSPYIRKLDRKVSFFSYGTRGLIDHDSQEARDKKKPQYNLDENINLPGSGGAEDFTSPVDLNPIRTENGKKIDIARDYLESMAKNFFDQGNITWELGRALYTATEPLASIGYSGNPGFLIEVEVPAQTHYLDIRIPHKDLPVSAEIALKYQCFLAKQVTEEIYLQQISRTTRENTFDPKLLLYSPLTRALAKNVFKKLQISFIAAGWGEYNYVECRRNPEQPFMTMAVFMNPEATREMRARIYVPALEKNPAPEKLKAYQNLLNYLDAFSCDSTDQSKLVSLCDPKSVSDDTAFWRYYSAIAPIVHQLPEGTDLKAFQKEQAAKWKNRRTQELTPKLFSCSPDERFSSEIFPPKGPGR